MEIFVFYVIPNIILFGGIFLIAKSAEIAIENYIDRVTGEKTS